MTTTKRTKRTMRTVGTMKTRTKTYSRRWRWWQPIVAIATKPAENYCTIVARPPPPPPPSAHLNDSALCNILLCLCTPCRFVYFFIFFSVYVSICVSMHVRTTLRGLVFFFISYNTLFSSDFVNPWCSEMKFARVPLNAVISLFRVVFVFRRRNRSPRDLNFFFKLFFIYLNFVRDLYELK